MSAYIIPNLILLLAIVGIIGLLARHWRQAEVLAANEARGSRGLAGARWISKGWLRRVWRFILEAKGLHHPVAAQTRMKQLLAANKRTRPSSVETRVHEAHTNARPVKNPVRVESGVQPAPEVVRPAVTAPLGSQELSSPEFTAPAADVVSTALPVSDAGQLGTVPEVVSPKPKKGKSHAQAKVRTPKVEVAAPPTDAEIEMSVMADKAKKHLEHKQFGPARALLLDLIRMDAENPLFWARLGYCQFHLGSYGEAARCYEKSLALDGNQPNRYYNLALAYDAAARRKEALAALGKAIELDAGNEKYLQTKEALMNA